MCVLKLISLVVSACMLVMIAWILYAYQQGEINGIFTICFLVLFLGTALQLTRWLWDTPS